MLTTPTLSGLSRRTNGKTNAVVALAAALIAGSASAQQAPAAPAKEEKPAPRPPHRRGCPTTSGSSSPSPIRRGQAPAEKRTVSMMVADRKVGSIRSQGAGHERGANPRRHVECRRDTNDREGWPDAARSRVRVQSPKPGSENATSGEGRGSLNQRCRSWSSQDGPWSSRRHRTRRRIGKFRWN